MLHGGGQLFHAGRSFFQTGGLLLGTLRQVIVARGDFFSLCVDVVSGVFNLIDDVLEFFHRGIGIILELPETADIVIADGLGQVVTGQCAQYAHHIIDAAFGDFHQSVKPFSQLFEEVCFALHFNAAGKIPHDCAMHKRRYFLLYLDFNSAIPPFGHRSQTLALFIDDRVSGHHHGSTAEIHFDGIGIVKSGQKLSLMCRVCMEITDIGADQIGGGEFRQLFTDIRFGLAENIDYRFVDVNDVACIVCNHHAGADVVQADFDA